MLVKNKHKIRYLIFSKKMLSLSVTIHHNSSSYAYIYSSCSWRRIGSPGTAGVSIEKIPGFIVFLNYV